MSNQKTRTDGKDSGTKRRSVPRKGQGQMVTGTQAETIRLEQAVEDPSAATPADLLALQASHGNRAVSSLIQTKLRVGPAGDSYEQEADRVADHALSRPVQPAGVQRQMDPEEEEIQAKPLAASITPLAQRQLADEEDELQTKPAAEPLAGQVQRVETDEEEEIQAAPAVSRAQDGFEASGSIEQRLASLTGHGSPLPDDLRADMEGRFGTDFGSVRVHADAESDELNRDLRAKAFTHKTDIYFSSGQYDADSNSGKHLLAHELTHVVQQTGGVPRVSSAAGVQGQVQTPVLSGQGKPAVQRVKIEEIDEEEEQTQSQGSQPLMLTDKPWSEIEKERSPVRKLLQSEHRTPFPQMQMPDLSSPIQKPSPTPQSQAPLMLTDKPWSEMEKEKEDSGEQPSLDPSQEKSAVPTESVETGAKAVPEEKKEGPPQISEPKAKPGQVMTGGGPDLWAENLMRQHDIDPKDWEILGKEQRGKLVSDIMSGNPKRAKRTLNKAKAEREGKAPGAWQTWKAGWGSFFKETIPAKLSALTPTSTRRAQQRALANRRQSLGGQAPAPQSAKSNIGTIEQFLKERRAAKAEKAESKKKEGSTGSGGVSGLDAGIKIGELQAEIKALRAKVEELETRA